MTEKTNFTINFYEVLGVEYNASLKEIKKQYTQLVIKYHPDKTKDPFEASLFELIQRAYETLGNEKKRQEYDFFLKNLEIAKNNDHIGLKNNFDKFKNLENEQPKSKESSQIEFDKVFSDLDMKHGIDRNILDEKIDAELISNRIDDLLLQREQDEIEFSQNNIFREGENFDISKFNAAFDLYKNTSDKQMIKKSNIQAFNFENSGNFSGLNVYEKTYDEDNFEGNNIHGTINFGKTNKLDSEKIKNINQADYTYNHNLKENNYEQELKKRLEERELETTKFNTMNYNDFNTEDKTFQFSQEIGITENMLDWGDNNDDLLKACKKLIELEKKK